MYLRPGPGNKALSSRKASLLACSVTLTLLLLTCFKKDVPVLLAATDDRFPSTDNVESHPLPKPVLDTTPAITAPAPPTYSDPVAVIIETTFTQNLIPLMLHFMAVLGPQWRIILYTLESTYVPPISTPFNRALASGHIEIRHLPPETSLSGWGEVSRFLTRPWFWETLEDTERVLIFQSDSMLCANSGARVEDFMAYDLIGAPIAADSGLGYNGGLSLRNPRLMLEVAREAPLEPEKAWGDITKLWQEYEDQYFFVKLREKGANLPDEETAKKFAVETVFYERPLGYHQPSRHQAERMEEIEAWCPEIKLAGGKRVWF